MFVEGSHGQNFQGTLLPTAHLIIVTNADNIGQIKNVYISVILNTSFLLLLKHIQ